MQAKRMPTVKQICIYFFLFYRLAYSQYIGNPTAELSRTYPCLHLRSADLQEGNCDIKTPLLLRYTRKITIQLGNIDP